MRISDWSSDVCSSDLDRLVLAVPPLLGRAAGRVALDDEELGLRRIAFLAVRQLAGQRGDVESALAPGQLARLARRLARAGRLDHLADDAPGLLRRSAARRVGKECVRTCRARGGAYH